MSETIATYIGKKGYTIYKECISGQEQQEVRNELTMRPYVPKSPTQPDPFPIYREAHNKFYLPRYYGLDNFGVPDENRIPKGTKTSMEFVGELREYQINIVNKYVNHVGNSGGGLLDVDPGKGKTVMGLYIATQLQVKTLVIVHKSFLLNQWIERIEQFIPNARVGRIQGPTIDIEDKDIVIGMLQSLSMKEYGMGSSSLNLVSNISNIFIFLISLIAFVFLYYVKAANNDNTESPNNSSIAYAPFIVGIIYAGHKMFSVISDYIENK